MMNQQIFVLKFTLKWLLIAVIVGLAIGSASAFFLVSLDWTTHFRENHQWLIWFLPLGGLAVGAIYHYFGQDVAKGNNQLIEEIQHPEKTIPFKMMPLILLTTLLTHLVGGSAGREGTAVQMGGAIADFFTKPLKFNNLDRKILLMMGISAGFASVFGTPLAGTIFALEVAFIGKVRYEAILPSLFSALVADYTCQELWHVGHTHYAIPEVPHLAISAILWAILAGILFGLVGMLFAKSTHFWSNLFKSKITYPPLRPVVGGVLLAILFFAVGTSKYNGLGVSVIVESFSEKLPFYDFLAKIFFTSLTLGSGFKGGEVTPLFYIGATMGNALTNFIPLPIALLAGMGFVGVFAGASNTPIACTLMGIELFGAESAIYLALACVMAYSFSGHSGIYSAQKIGVGKHKIPDEEFL
ncbi:voltage-gated chloride channel family protein [Arcicella lustrica]|uniref:Voltage-gated chloride channel family protein n=1 Tax=Arcicella lustrica TaxID=2984196 RepID=A0ABU5SM43_9BACT|nr:voltage-gated chloride channel family protein [Arcicella sp. DC25W]MEA5428309.1 voltage-gated chloride channel family protein [Arcicella sp. DC25W]